MSSLTMFKENDFAHYREGYGDSERYIVVKVVKAAKDKKSNNGLVIRFSRSQFMRDYSDNPTIRSDWPLLNCCVPMSDIDQLAYVTGPDFKDDYEFFDESV